MDWWDAKVLINLVSADSRENRLRNAWVVRECSMMFDVRKAANRAQKSAEAKEAMGHVVICM